MNFKTTIFPFGISHRSDRCVGWLLFFVFLITITSIVEAQSSDSLTMQAVNTTDAAGRKQGLWRIKNKNNTIEEGKYVNGKKEGEWTATFASGSKKHILTYVAGLPKGKALFFYEDGQVMEEGTWDVSHWKGKYTFYHRDGQLAYQFNFNDAGKRDGLQQYFHENGKLKYSGTWVEGAPNGTVEVYNEEGEKTAERVYDEGTFTASRKTVVTDQSNSNAPLFDGTGNFTLLNKNGTIDRRGTFKNGYLIDGEIYEYDQSGKRTRVVKYKNGNPVE